MSVSKEITVTKSNIIKVWDSYIESITPPQIRDGEVSASDEVEGYTADELILLWTLLNGNDGKLPPGDRVLRMQSSWGTKDTEQLVDFVHQPDPRKKHTKTTEWFKFFKYFGADAKGDFLSAHRTSWRDYDGITMNANGGWGIAELLFAEEEEMERPELPMKLFPVFFKDPSYLVRTNLACKANLPEVIASLLTEDARLEVVADLTTNMGLSEKNLSKVFTRIENTKKPHPDEGVHKRTRLDYHLIPFIHHRIASHPHITPRMAEKYLQKSSDFYSLEEELYANPSVPTVLIQQKYNEYKKRYEELVAQKPLRTDETQKGTLVAVESSGQSEENYDNEDGEMFILEKKLQWLLSSGKCPLKETREALKEYRNHADPYTKYIVTVTVSRAPLSGEELEDYYNLAESSKDKRLLLAVVLNSGTPKEIFQRRVETAQSGTRTGKLSFYESLANGVAERRLLDT